MDPDHKYQASPLYPLLGWLKKHIQAGSFQISQHCVGLGGGERTLTRLFHHYFLLLFGKCSNESDQNSSYITGCATKTERNADRVVFRYVLNQRKISP